VPGLRREEVATLASVSGRLAQRRFAADLLDVPASELRVRYHCPRCGTGPGVSHGRPGYSWSGSAGASATEPNTAVPLLLSLSRAAGWTLLAAVVDPAPGLRLGIDVEDPGRLDFDGFDAVALAPAERQSLRGLSGEALRRGRAGLWTRKEAWLKMTGEGLERAPETFDVLHRSGIRDLAPAETGLPADLVAAVALSRPRLGERQRRECLLVQPRVQQGFGVQARGAVRGEDELGR
jgi:4'-phosphopantetheinyl transferase